MPKKKKKTENKSLQSECLVKFALRNINFELIFIDFISLFDVYQLYENIYWSKLSMISPIIHSSNI
jgi:hypothetical protein